jgi:CTP:phosphocholine cytidylyltransferase-like protein
MMNTKNQVKRVQKGGKSANLLMGVLTWTFSRSHNLRGNA